LRKRFAGKSGRSDDGYNDEPFHNVVSFSIET